MDEKILVVAIEQLNKSRDTEIYTVTNNGIVLVQHMGYKNDKNSPFSPIKQQVPAGGDVQDEFDIIYNYFINLKDYGLDASKNKDIAIFKNIYAITDKANRNKRRLPKELVEKKLASLSHKPINIDPLAR